MKGLPTIEQGVVLWGLLLAVWLLVLFGALLHGWWVNPECGALRGGSAYCVVLNNGNPVAAITAVLGVIWSWFFQLAQKKRELDQKDVELKLRALELQREQEADAKQGSKKKT